MMLVLDKIICLLSPSINNVYFSLNNNMFGLCTRAEDWLLFKNSNQSDDDDDALLSSSVLPAVSNIFCRLLLIVHRLANRFRLFLSSLIRNIFCFFDTEN